MSKIIIAIGGGLLENLETKEIDEEIIRLTKKKNPVALFIPPQSRDIKKYWNIFQKVYGNELGCKTVFLDLNGHTPSEEGIKDKILSADLIYVGGGNSLQMMRRWRKLGVDKLLKQAYEKGIVLSGISAGALCWFDYGLSNSLKNYNHDWKYIRVKGLGLIPGMNTPHYTDEQREQVFENLIKKKGGIGIALDNNTAIEVVDEKYRIITSKVGPKVYKVFKKNGKVVTKTVEQSEAYKNLKTLFQYPS